ncbi:MAG TPA: efflux RND transporter permease subunit [Woeseiaceae bacterium]|nr:efflux RND transporter permease subunit [Woeseiaceae bacterium]
MNFTGVFIRRPVLATVVSLLILLMGLRAWQDLELRQFPEIEQTQIIVTTFYPGANADLIQGFITAPIQRAVASVEGVDYITSESRQSFSTITVNLELNYDRYQAFTEVQAKVAEVRNELPTSAEAPVIQMGQRMGAALMYIGFYSEGAMTPEQVTDYLIRVVQPQLQTLEGVASADVLGARTFAMRVWLNPVKMAAHDVTALDVADALQANNYLAAVGETKGELVSVNISAATDLHAADEFGEIVLREDDGSLVRIEDVAQVELGAESYDSSVLFTGKRAVYIGISPVPGANPLDAAALVHEQMAQVVANLPAGLQGQVVYDGTEYIESSVDEVIKTVAEAGLIVVAVIFLFLGSLRAVAIPVVTIPLSLIGAMFVMLALGYSINVLTLLAMVLAIGLVVDDAIVVVENIHRHIEEGLSPFDAALQGAREIAGPVVAMSLTLAAVYAPIGFLGGLTGNLFQEFAFTLAAAVLISGLIALTLSPMMCSKLLQPIEQQGKLAQRLDHAFERLKGWYQRRLHGALDTRPVVLVVAAAVLASCFFLYTSAQQELAPMEDQGFVFISATGPQNATHDYMQVYAREIDSALKSIPEMEAYFMINGMGTVNNLIAGMILEPWNQRERSQTDIQPIVQQKLSQIAGVEAVAINFPSLPGSSGLPVQFVINTTESYAELYGYTQELLQAAQASGLFIFVDTNLTFDQPQLQVQVNRNKAAELGIDMADIGRSLSTLLGGGFVNRFNLEGRAYEVIPQVADRFRRDGSQLNQYYIRAADGQMVPLSTVVQLTHDVQPNRLTQFQQLNSANIQGVMVPGVTLGAALDFLEAKAAEILPPGYTVNYAGESRQFVEEGGALLFTFLFALIVIYLVLAAQFESFRDPLIILIAVPMSICGALIPLAIGIATVNIFTQIGLVTLIGLISKHGILMVEFANKLQLEQGLDRRAAIEEAAAIRLRPILMTTAAIVLGVLPLILATGAGAESRFSIGLVVATGMAIGTAFTLFVVPAIYTLLAGVETRTGARVRFPKTLD